MKFLQKFPTLSLSVQPHVPPASDVRTEHAILSRVSRFHEPFPWPFICAWNALSVLVNFVLLKTHCGIICSVNCPDPLRVEPFLHLPPQQQPA